MFAGSDSDDDVEKYMKREALNNDPSEHNRLRDIKVADPVNSPSKPRKK